MFRAGPQLVWTTKRVWAYLKLVKVSVFRLEITGFSGAIGGLLK